MNPSLLEFFRFHLYSWSNKSPPPHESYLTLLQIEIQERYSESKWCSDIAKLPQNWSFLGAIFKHSLIPVMIFFTLSACMVDCSNAKIKMHVTVAEKLFKDWKWSDCNFKVKMSDLCRGDFFDQEYSTLSNLAPKGSICTRFFFLN